MLYPILVVDEDPKIAHIAKVYLAFLTLWTIMDKENSH